MSSERDVLRATAIGQVMVQRRDNREFRVLNGGLIISERDGTPSEVIRMGIFEALSIADRNDPLRAELVKMRDFYRDDIDNITGSGVAQHLTRIIARYFPEES